MNHSQAHFQRRYCLALRRDLGGARKSGAAGLIGASAVSLGLGASDLARAHALALAVLSSLTAKGVIDAPSLARAGRFLVAALAPLERIHTAARKAAHRLVVAQEEERRAISRELHDEIAQVLAGVTLRLARLAETSALNARTMRQVITETQKIIEHSVVVVHRFARELRPALLDDLGLIPTLRSYIRDMPGRGKLRIRFHAVAEVEQLDNIGRTVLYRVAQQALTNVARHAEAQEASVTIRRKGTTVRLEVTDDGKSFAADAVLNGGRSGRLGLIGMRERVEMIGGTFAVKSSRGAGTAVSAQIPFHVRTTQDGG